MHRFCCQHLKEYPVLPKSIIGVRKSESIKRNIRYSEPTQCRIFSKSVRVEQILPILQWSDSDILDFINAENIHLHPIYYTPCGNIDISQRLGCLDCPLKSKNKRVRDLKKYPNLLKLKINALSKFYTSHPDNKTAQRYLSPYTHFFRDLFFNSDGQLKAFDNTLFQESSSHKQILQDYFNIDL